MASVSLAEGGWPSVDACMTVDLLVELSILFIGFTGVVTNRSLPPKTRARQLQVDSTPIAPRFLPATLRIPRHDA